MYVCLCHGVTEQQIREVAQAGCRSVSELTMRTGAGSCCGSCLDTAAALMDEAQAAKANPVALPVLSNAA